MGRAARRRVHPPRRAPSSPGALPTARPHGLRIVGAHTDSPCLRIHPHADQARRQLELLGVEVYGGVLLNSWLDRDLGIAGRVVAADGTSTLVDVREPIARVPQLAIHLDREVNDRGLVLDRHVHLRPVWATGASPDGADFADWLGERAGAAPAFWELCLYDLQPAAVLGADRSLIASGRLDNQVSCWAAVSALAATEPGPHHRRRRAVRSRGGRVGVGQRGVRAVARRRHRARSSPGRASTPSTTFVGSSPRRAACRRTTPTPSIPTTPSVTTPGHAPLVNNGPAIKLNANQRYATDAATAALFRACCEKAGVPVQTFVSRNNIPCGSTIGPLTATRLGIATVDVGVPQLSMHSARELCGAADPAHLVAALAAYWS